MDQSERRELIDQLRCQYWSKHGRQWRADDQQFPSIESAWPTTRSPHQVNLLKPPRSGAGRCAVSAECQHMMYRPDCSIDSRSRPMKQHTTLQPTHKGSKRCMYSQHETILLSHVKIHQPHLGLLPRPAFQRTNAATYTAHNLGHISEQPVQPACGIGWGRNGCGAAKVENLTDLDCKGVAYEQQISAHHDEYNRDINSINGSVFSHEHLRDGGDNNNNNNNSSGITSSSSSRTTSRTSSADTFSLRNTAAESNSDCFCSHCCECCGASCSCSCHSSECSSSSSYTCNTADSADDNAGNLQVAYTCIERAAPAISFGKASRWPTRTPQQQQQVAKHQGSSSSDRKFDRVQHSTAEADDAFAIARNVLRAAAAAAAAAAEEAYELAQQIVSWTINQPAAAVAAAAEAAGGGPYAAHAAHSGSSSSSKPAVINGHLKPLQGPSSFKRMPRLKTDHHKQQQQQQQQQHQKQEHLCKATSAAAQQHQQQKRPAYGSISLDLIKPKAATISFAHPSVRVQMQQLLRQRQQQKAQQHQRQQTVVAASPQDNHAQLRQ